MKRRMKLLLADLIIGALALVYGCPLWWIGMIEVWKTVILRSPLFVRYIMRANTKSLKSCKTLWGKNRQEGEQLI